MTKFKFWNRITGGLLTDRQLTIHKRSTNLDFKSLESPSQMFDCVRRVFIETWPVVVASHFQKLINSAILFCLSNNKLSNQLCNINFQYIISKRFITWLSNFFRTPVEDVWSMGLLFSYVNVLNFHQLDSCFLILKWNRENLWWTQISSAIKVNASQHVSLSSVKNVRTHFSSLVKIT
jgi:hypothetical protein